jgi:hypothetical protein
MYIGRDFTDIDVGEEENFAFDFADDLAEGESLVTTVWTCSVAKGSLVNDPNPASRLDGPAAVQGTQSVQRIAGQLAGVKYLLRADVVTNFNNKPALWSHVTCIKPS